MSNYKFTKVEPVGRLRAAQRLDEQSAPNTDMTCDMEKVIPISETVNTKDMLDELSKRLSHIEISDDAHGDNKVCLVFGNGEEYAVNISKVDDDGTETE